jgi:hypothetical protein
VSKRSAETNKKPNKTSKQTIADSTEARMKFYDSENLKQRQTKTNNANLLRTNTGNDNIQDNILLTIRPHIPDLPSIATTTTTTTTSTSNTNNNNNYNKLPRQYFIIKRLPSGSSNLPKTRLQKYSYHQNNLYHK